VSLLHQSAQGADRVVLLAAYAALLGLVIGSFGNVVVARLPAGGSLVTPSSRCPHCGNAIRARHNVPLLGWLVLRGRCADCRGRISARYPLVELGTAVLFGALTLRLGRIDLLPALPAYLYIGAAGLVLALIDLDIRRLPDSIVLPSYVVLAVLLAVASAWRHEWADLERAAAGGAALYCLYFAIAFAYPAGMGFGDVKLSGLLGAVLGYLSWGSLLAGAFAGFLLGSIAGVAVMAFWGGTRKTALPFGPFMIAGALVGIFAGDALAGVYLRLATRT
jgi:leader peptidase (prepilin peptidase)/N-methyltransferase